MKIVILLTLLVFILNASHANATQTTGISWSESRSVTLATEKMKIIRSKMIIKMTNNHIVIDMKYLSLGDCNIVTIKNISYGTTITCK